jgi:hypothetical protein
MINPMDVIDCEPLRSAGVEELPVSDGPVLLSELLAPRAFAMASEIAADPRLVPAVAGIYGWWFEDGALPIVPKQDSLHLDGRRLLYVGIAPSAPSSNGRISKRTLRDRLKNHTRGPVAQSTLRRTLVALLSETLELSPVLLPSGKLSMSRAEEAALTQWMSDHARVAWMLHPAPWILEHALISGGPRPPLNIRDSLDPFRLELKLLRRRIRN